MAAPGRLRVGTSGWVYTHWKGTFYPEELPAAQRLAYYAERFDCVEVNNTYYRLLSESAAHAWLETVPENFSFAFKAHRRITHMKRLNDAAEPLQLFLDALRPFGDRAEVVLFQLPPFMAFDAERLDSFLDIVPKHLPHRYAFEFRNPTWHNEQTYEILGAHGVAFVIHDFDDMPPELEVTADMVYLRLHGPAGPYRGRYTLETMNEWARRLDAWRRQGRDCYAFFNNDQEGYAAFNALELRGLAAPAPEAPRV